MQRYVLSGQLACGLALWVSSAAASERSFVYNYESRVLSPGDSELQPWTTLRSGRERYFSRLDARLELDHGITPGLQLGLHWSFSSQTRDVLQDELTGALRRVSDSELASASLEMKYQLSDAAADALGSALYVKSTLGPSATQLEGRLIVDRALGRWLFAGNLPLVYELEPVRDATGTELDEELLLEPALGITYRLGRGLSVGVELRAPIGLAGDVTSSSLFGGPVAAWASRSFWLSLGVQPQLVAFSGQSAGSRLDLQQHERVEVRLIAGFAL